MMNGLKLFSRTNCKGLWNLASYHSPHSLTWSWILSLRFPRKGEGRWRPFFFSHRGNNGLQWSLGGMKFHLQWQTQRPMYYRDMWIRKREAEDRDSYDRYLMRSAQAEHNSPTEHQTLQ